LNGCDVCVLSRQKEMSAKGHKQTHALQLSDCSAFNVRQNAFHVHSVNADAELVTGLGGKP
jgi:hypothetical protein